MVSLASSLQDTLLLRQEYLPWEIAYYVRHDLQNISFHDLSSVDNLIEMTKSSFTDAMAACAYMHLRPEYASHYRIQTLLQEQSMCSSLVIGWMWDQTQLDLDAEILAHLKKEPMLDNIFKGNGNWQQLCDLHSLIAVECLGVMDRSLRFNICSIPTSYKQNDDPQMKALFWQAQSEKHITSALVYACSHWVYHALFATSNDRLIDLAGSFLEKHMFHWLEVISLAGQNLSVMMSQLHKLTVRNRHSVIESVFQFI